MIGGAIGAGLRYQVGQALASDFVSRWPMATLTVNLLGALAMGLIAGWAATRGVAEEWRLLVGVGVLGGFTTFSAFSLEMWQMLERGALFSALGYAILSVVGTVAMLAIGIMISRAIAA